MRFQSHKSTCGPAALHNALEALGTDRSEDELSSMCGTTTDGTSEKGIKRACKALAVSCTTISERKFIFARLLLFEAITTMYTAIISVDKGEHWVAVVGLSGSRFIIVDSADNNLVLFWDYGKLEEKWSGAGNYYGIILG